MLKQGRLQEVLQQAALAIEALYKELDRKPPPEAIELIKELHQFFLLMKDGGAA